MIRVAVHGDLPEKQLNSLAETLRDEMQSLPHVSIVELFGTRREEVSIEVSEEALRRWGLSFQEVADAVRGTSVNLSSGRIRTQTGDVLLRARNMADTEEDFGGASSVWRAPTAVRSASATSRASSMASRTRISSPL